mmetsp:Transcript_6435/g.10918  ORF Transcript_6435/g.10918 Transcript_6435/m.10918 type:complete len:155 (-) Transcript_6435:164-628(-)
MVGVPFRGDEQMDYDYSIKLLYRVQGVLEEDFFALHVKHSGLKLWSQESGAINRVECPEYKGQIDQIKATQDGKYLLVGFPNSSIVQFYRIDREAVLCYILENGKINIQYDFFETDENLSIMVFKCKQSLELYLIKWIFDMSKLDLNKLKKLDD